MSYHFPNIPMSAADGAEYDKRIEISRATAYIPYQLRHKDTLPSEYTDISLYAFTDKNHETSIKLKFPGMPDSSGQDSTILLTFPPHQHRGFILSPKPFQVPSATVTFPASASYHDMVELLNGGAAPKEINGVRVETTTNPGSVSGWNLKLLERASDIRRAEDTIRVSLASGASNDFARDHLVPVNWDHGEATKALLMTRAQGSQQWIPTAYGGYSDFGYPESVIW